MGNSPDVELLNQGFVCFCAWRKLMEGLSDEQLWAESERSRRLLNQWLESDHTVALNAQSDQMAALSRECVIYEDAPLVCESADVIEAMNVFYCNVLNA